MKISAQGVKAQQMRLKTLIGALSCSERESDDEKIKMTNGLCHHIVVLHVFPLGNRRTKQRNNSTTSAKYNNFRKVDEYQIRDSNVCQKNRQQVRTDYGVKYPYGHSTESLRVLSVLPPCTYSLPLYQLYTTTTTTARYSCSLSHTLSLTLHSHSLSGCMMVPSGDICSKFQTKIELQQNSVKAIKATSSSSSSSRRAPKCLGFSGCDHVYYNNSNPTPSRI